MSEQANDGSSKPQSSPWPMFVALGLALSEVGVVLGLRPVSVGGLLLFVVTVAGILKDADYVVRPERAVGVLGGALILIGSVLIVNDQTGTTIRGQSIVIAGVISLVAVPLWHVFVQARLNDETTDRRQSANQSDD